MKCKRSSCNAATVSARCVNTERWLMEPLSVISPLSMVGGSDNRHTGIEANVAWQEELIKVARGHVAGEHRANVFGWNVCTLQGFARGFDAHVGGGDVAQGTTVIDHRGANAFVHPHVFEGIEKSGLAHDATFRISKLGGGLQDEVQALFMQCGHCVSAVR